MKKTVNKLVGQGKAEVKLAIRMFTKLIEEKMIDMSQLVEAFDALCASVVANLEAEKEALRKSAASLKDALTQLFSQDSPLQSLDLSVEAKKLLGLTPAESQEAEGAASDDLVEKIVESSERGEALCKLIPEGVSDSIALGKQLLSKLYEKPNACTELEWIDAGQYGAVLAKLIYREQPKTKEVEAQVEVVYAVQEAFHKAGFPRNAQKKPLIELTFIRLYKNEILAEEAYLAWKDDSSDRPGKLDAIVQTTKFLDFLQEEEESSEEEDEDEDEQEDKE